MCGVLPNREILGGLVFLAVGGATVTTTLILCPPAGAGLIAGAVTGGSSAIGGAVSAIVGIHRNLVVIRELECTTSDLDPVLATLQDDLATYAIKVRDVNRTLWISQQQQDYNVPYLIRQLTDLYVAGERLKNCIQGAREHLEIDEIQIQHGINQ